jgi:hypothetical protein
MQTKFYWPTSKSKQCTQGILRPYKWVQLTKEAHATINACQCEASHHYKKDLDETWVKIDEATENLAITHHKSVHRVQGELHMGRNMAHTKQLKTSAWNAFSWKKNMMLKQQKHGRVNDISLWSYFFLIACFS